VVVGAAVVVGRGVVVIEAVVVGRGVLVGTITARREPGVSASEPRFQSSQDQAHASCSCLPRSFPRADHSAGLAQRLRR